MNSREYASFRQIITIEPISSGVRRAVLDCGHVRYLTRGEQLQVGERMICKGIAYPRFDSQRIENAPCKQ